MRALCGIQIRAKTAFTLLELLIVIAIIATLAGMLLPVLGKAKQRAQMATCLNNLHQIGLGLHLYLNDFDDTFPPGALSQLDHSISLDSPNNIVYGNALGGADPSPAAEANYPRAANRLVTPYTGAESWHCPADRGFGMSIRPSNFKTYGNSYRFNWYLSGDYYRTGVAVDPDYNLGLKKESWIAEPSRFILLHEMAVYPWQVGSDIEITQWHYASKPGTVFNENQLKLDANTLLAPILFVDAHTQKMDFSPVIRSNPFRGLEPTKDYMWYKPER